MVIKQFFTIRHLKKILDKISVFYNIERHSFYSNCSNKFKGL